jgi:glutamine amidotransferase
VITIIDYRTGNLNSIRNMLKKIGAPSAVATSPDDVLRAGKLIIPGVGAFDAGMSRLEESGLIPSLNEAVRERHTPILGVCLGMQLLTTGSTEGTLAGLGWIDADTVRFDQTKDPGLKVPHMGWNVASPAKPSPLLQDMPDEARFYFVHSYYVRCHNAEDRLLSVTHGATTFDAAIEHGHIRGVQFHPEKSHRFGMWLLRNFVERC